MLSIIVLYCIVLYCIVLIFVSLSSSWLMDNDGRRSFVLVYSSEVQCLCHAHRCKHYCWLFFLLFEEEEDSCRIVTPNLAPDVGSNRLWWWQVVATPDAFDAVAVPVIDKGAWCGWRLTPSPWIKEKRFGLPPSGGMPENNDGTGGDAGADTVAEAVRRLVAAEAAAAALTLFVPMLSTNSKAFSSRIVSNVLAGREWMAFRARRRFASLSIDWFMPFVVVNVVAVASLDDWFFRFDFDCDCLYDLLSKYRAIVGACNVLSFANPVLVVCQ